METTVLTWHGLNDDTRVDHAVIRLSHAGMYAFGTSVNADYALSWSLDASDGWVTRTLGVHVESLAWARSLALERNSSGAWTSEATTVGRTDLPEPGLVDPASVEGAIDCDLGLCPVTNTMPIRRLRLLSETVAATPLVMAWVEVPSLRVIRSDQMYASSTSPGKVEYRSFSRDFHAELSVDPDGLVVEYPGLARRSAR